MFLETLRIGGRQGEAIGAERFAIDFGEVVGDLAGAGIGVLLQLIHSVNQRALDGLKRR